MLAMVWQSTQEYSLPFAWQRQKSVAPGPLVPHFICFLFPRHSPGFSPTSSMKFDSVRFIIVLAIGALAIGCATDMPPNMRGQTIYLEGLTVPAPQRPAYTPVEDTFSYLGG